MNKRITITKNNIASIALLYNYLVNNKSNLSTEEIDSFYNKYISMISNKYKDKYIFLDVEFNENDFARNNIYISNILYNYYYRNNSFKSPNKIYEKDYLGVTKDEEEYVINDINAIMLNYRSLPDEIIDFSLNNEVLNTINIHLDDLKYDTFIKQYDNYLDIASLSEKRALELAKSKISNCGLYDISINNITYLNDADSHNYRISYEAKKDYKKVNIKEMILKR